MTVTNSGTAQAGASTTITLASGASAVNDIYNGQLIATTGGVGPDQANRITDYVGSTRVATVLATWVTTPDNTTTYEVTADAPVNVEQWRGSGVSGAIAGQPDVSVKRISTFSSAATRLGRHWNAVDFQSNVASGTSTTIVFDDAVMSSVDGFYVGQIVMITGGTGLGLAKRITGYVGSTKTATIVGTWPITPDATSDIQVFPGPGDMDVNVTQVSGVAEDLATATALATVDTEVGVIDGIVDNILIDTAVIGAAGAGLTALPISDANVTQLGGSAQSLTDIKDFADDGYDPATNKVTGVVLVDTTTTNTDMVGTDGANTTTPPTVAAISDGVWDEAKVGHVGANTFGQVTQDTETDATAILADTNELQGDDVPGLIATLDTVVDTVKVDTAAILVDTSTTLQGELDGIQTDTEDIQTQIGTAGAGLTAIPVTDVNVAQWLGTAPLTPNTDGLPRIDVDRIKNDSAAGDVLARIFGIGTIFEDTITAATSTTVTLSGATNIPASSAGNDDLLNNRVLIVQSGTGAQQIRVITDYDGTTQVATVATFDITPDTSSSVVVLAMLVDPSSSLTVAGIADGVLDEALSGHTSAGTLGKALADVETDATAILADTNELQGDDVPGLIAALNDPTAAAIADAVLDELTAGHTTTGSLSKAIIDILADTNELQTDDVPGLISTLDAVVDTVKAETALIVADTNELQGDDVPTLISALNDPTAATVATAVWAETLSEPSGMYAWTGTYAQVFNVLAGMMRNQIKVTTTSIDFYNDAGDTVLWAYAISDTGSVFTNAEGT